MHGRVTGDGEQVPVELSGCPHGSALCWPPADDLAVVVLGTRVGAAPTGWPSFLPRCLVVGQGAATPPCCPGVPPPIPGGPWWLRHRPGWRLHGRRSARIRLVGESRWRLGQAVLAVSQFDPLALALDLAICWRRSVPRYRVPSSSRSRLACGYRRRCTCPWRRTCTGARRARHHPDIPLRDR